MRKTTILGFVALAIGIGSFSGYAESAENLLRNVNWTPDKSNADIVSEWTLVPAQGWDRHEIVSFHGQPFDMFAMRRNGEGQLVQTNIAVKSNAWYVLSAWYRGETLSLELNAPRGSGAPVMQGNARFGSAEDWLPIRGFIHSGDNERLNYKARFSGQGAGEIGRCELRELTETDALAGPFIFDGNFENSLPGGRPLDFWGRPNEPQPTVTEDGNYPGGKRSMKITLEPGKPNMFLFGPCFPPLLKPGSRIHIALWAKASRAGASLFSNVGGAGWGDKVGIELTPEWQALKHTLVAGANVPSNGLTRLFLISASATNEATVIWVDNISLSIEPPGEKEDQSMTGKNPVLNGSFESGFYGWIFRFTGGVLNDEPKYEKPGRVALDQSTAAEGQCSLRVEVPPGLDTYHPLGFSLTSARFPVAPDDTCAISFWAKADCPGRIEARINPGAQASGGMVAVTSEWQRYSVTAIPACPGGDSKIMLRFRIDKPGTYWIDGIQIEKGKQAGPYQPNNPLEIGATVPDLFKVYNKDETKEALVTMCSRLGKPAKLNFSCDFKDWKGRVIKTVRQAIEVTPDKPNTFPLPLPTDKFGTIVARLKLEDPESKQVGASDFIYGVFPEPRSIDPEQSWFGIHSGSLILFQDRGWLSLPGGNLDDLFRLIRRVGFCWECPMNMGVWRTMEAQPGKWRWPDMYVDVALRNGVKLKPILVCKLFSERDVPAWAKSDREIKNEYYNKRGKKACYPKMDAWKNFVRRFTEHYSNKIDAIEIFGETGGAEPEAYVEYVKTAREAAREVNPAIRIVAPGYPCWGMPYGPDDNTWVGQVMKAGLYEWIDVYSPHFYPPYSYGDKGIETYVCEHGTRENLLARQMDYYRSNYGDKPVWDTETGQCGRSQYGFAESYGGYEYVNEVSPRVQAERFVRWSVMKKAAGVSRLFYHILPLTVSAWGSVHEMFDNDLSPNPKVSACAQLARRTELATFVRKITIGKATWIYQFEVEDEKSGAKRPLIIYWNYETPDEAKIRVPLTAADITVEDMMGNRIDPEAKDGAVILPLDSGVHYVVSERLTGDALMKAFEEGVVRGVTPAQVNVALCAHDQRPAIAVGVLNMQDCPLSGVFTVTGFPANWKVVTNQVTFSNIASETEKVGYVAGKGEDESGVFRNGFTGTITAVGKFADDDKVYTGRREMTLATAGKKASEIVIDGNISMGEYGDAETIMLGGAEQLKYCYSGSGTNASASVKIAWDPDAVYFGVQVRDTNVANNAEDDLLWKGDCVEIYLDTAPDRDLNDHKYNTHQGKIVCAPGARPGQNARLLLCKTPGGKLENIDMEKVKAAYCKTDVGYNLEIMIPVKDRTLSAPTIWGFNMSLLNDNAAQWLWVGGQEVWSNPHAWGFLMLASEGYPK